MTEPNAVPGRKLEIEEISLLALAIILLRRRRMIASLALLGAAVGMTNSLLTARLYLSTGTFIPQGPEAPTSGLAAAASQFGLRVPTTNSTWGPSTYVELLRSRSLLEPIALDTVVVAEDGGRRTSMAELFEIQAATPARRTELTVDALRSAVVATEVKGLGAVRLSVMTKWPSVSLSLAQKLVRGVNRFNIETRMSQATAERQFVDVRAREAEHALREAEDRLQAFQERNRVIVGSPELAMQRDRLQREVGLRQQVYTTLLQSREEAKIREVRDTPVITVLDDPRLPLTGEARGSVRKALFDGAGALIIGVLIALIAHAASAARREPSAELNTFLQLLDEATPRFLKRRAR